MSLLYSSSACVVRGLSARRRYGEIYRALHRCPEGSTRGGGSCVNIDECLENPCKNRGTCVDREPARRYDCICSFGYTGHDCELELLASGIITPSRDFIIAIIVCLFMLLGEHRYSICLHVIIVCLLVNFIVINNTYSNADCFIVNKLYTYGKLYSFHKQTNMTMVIIILILFYFFKTNG